MGHRGTFNTTGPIKDGQRYVGCKGLNLPYDKVDILHFLAVELHDAFLKRDRVVLQVFVHSLHNAKVVELFPILLLDVLVLRLH